MKKNNYQFPGIARDVSPRMWQDWRWQMRNHIRSVRGLADLSGLSAGDMPAMERVTEKYRLGATPYYLSLADLGDARDPIRRQFFPDPMELDDRASIGDDPLAEERDMPVTGLIHRYRDRCLLITTTCCTTYCRHCNRKRYWGTGIEGEGRKAYFEAMIDYVTAHKEVREVIISGGD
ncbi:MAG: lysine 2,3-aminomutase, partial [Smithellaceae bacterium]|nr:lysine 2,3-aminomutase [Smithellaceae bacterium]